MERDASVLVRLIHAVDLSEIKPVVYVPAKAIWTFSDQGAADGESQMLVDQQALDAMLNGTLHGPRLRFFQWSEPTITFGYLLSEPQVQAWAKNFPAAPIVRRPTGGGAVYHDVTDLSLSLLWPRGSGVLPEHPRACYEAIHERLKDGLERTWGRRMNLYMKPDGSCETPRIDTDAGRFSVCFQEPVCNDVMLEGKKIIGGALRITKKAILYQGTIQISNGDLKLLKAALLENFLPS